MFVEAKTIEKRMKTAMPVVLSFLLVYLYFALFTDVSHVGVTVLEYGLLSFFAAELAVKYRLSDGWRDFLATNWLKIVLLLPFLRVFRVFSTVGLVGRSVAPWLGMLPYAQKFSKVPMMLKDVKPFALAAIAALSLGSEDDDGIE